MVTFDTHEVGILAGLLGYPGEESLEVLEELGRDVAWLQEALPELRKTSLDHWQGEHTRLFISGIPKTVCPPFESAWRSDQMGGEKAVQVATIYRQAGLMPEQGLEMPDYLGTLLEGAVYLSTTDLIPQEERQRLLGALWNDHIASWVPEFAAVVAYESELELYRVLGRRLQRLFEGGHTP